MKMQKQRAYNTFVAILEVQAKITETKGVVSEVCNIYIM